GDVEPSCKGQYEFTNLRGLLPDDAERDIIEGMEHFGGKIQGFSDDDVLFAGVESRTSSPVRIVRDGTFQSNIRGIYPVGEGAGYAGGIMSAAADGLKAAESYAKAVGNDDKE
ncbi:MAG: FAD-dependent oxidoreductase, partial [Lachnospiraceae bacterium]|nr:FAD-dependent oxidoreductase [Lachnospiraceae bacterium]